MSNSQTVLRIDSSARGSDSISRQLTDYLMDKLHSHGKVELLHHDVGHNPFTPVTSDQLIAIHGSLPSDDPAVLEQKAISDQLVEEVLKTDVLVIGSPMYNFGIPANLKMWIDHICRARKTFRYTENGPEGLSDIKEAYLIVASGGAPIGSPMDFVSPYLTQVCEFIGVEKINVIAASGSNADPQAVLVKGREQIDALIGPSAAA